MRNRIFVCVIVGLFALTLFVSRLFAVEGGLGRPISGAAIAPYAGLVPPEPGLALTIGEAYYDGSIGGAIPLGNFNLNLGIEMVASFTPIAIVHLANNEQAMELCLGHLNPVGVRGSRSRCHACWLDGTPERSRLWAF